MTQDEKLDEALKETFPASDAFYVPSGPTSPAGSNNDRSREIIEAEATVRDFPSEDT